MSYILDALNKSQKEQSSHSIPTINAYHVSGSNKSRAPLYLVVFFVLIIANLLTVFLWLNPEALSLDLSSDSTLQPNLQKSSSSVEARTGADTLSTGDPRTGDLNTSRNPTSINPVKPSDLIQSSGLVSLASLPLPARDIIGSMVFSSHIYSEHPDLRAVSIDGTSFRENQIIRDGFRLEQVTQEGVVLSYLNYRFEVNVIGEWTL